MDLGGRNWTDEALVLMVLTERAGPEIVEKFIEE